MFHKVQLIKDGQSIEADAPFIVSASRATDIPAFFSPWLMSRIHEGYCVRRNRHNDGLTYTSFENCKLIVFWTKNPIPLLPYLDQILQMGYKFYIHYTLNYYDFGGYEPNLPPLLDRVKAFEDISNKYGRHTVIWRYDPIFIGMNTDVRNLLTRIKQLGNTLSRSTNKLVFSFADLHRYPRVTERISRSGFLCRELTAKERMQFVEGLALINNKHFTRPLHLAACSEADDFRSFGVLKNRCIDPELIERIIPEEKAVLQSLGIGQTQLSLMPGLASPEPQKTLFIKDKSQRHECGCAPSKDIGEYNTCKHGCIYCYATKN